MPPAKESQKAVTDHLNSALNEISSAMLADDAADPQIQQILTQLQQGLVAVVHAIRQAKAQQMSQAGSQNGQQMSAAPGQQGYGGPAVSDMAMAGGGGGGGAPGGGDEMARVLGPSNRGMQ